MHTKIAIVWLFAAGLALSGGCTAVPIAVTQDAQPDASAVEDSDAFPPIVRAIHSVVHRRPRPPFVPYVDPRTPAQKTAAACTGPSGKWMCPNEKQPVTFAAANAPTNMWGTPQPSWSTTDWYVDPSSTVATCNDGNSCTTSATPCCTFGQIFARWGTREPYLNTVPITFHVQSGQSATQAQQDLLWMAPHFLAAPAAAGTSQVGWIYILGLPVTAATTTISAFTAKNRATPQALKVTLTAAVGGKGKFYVNTTHPSNAFSVSGAAGGSNFMTQPINCPTPLQGASIAACGEVNTWTSAAGGDAILIKTLPTIALGSLLPVVEYMGFDEGGGIYVQNVDIFKFNGEDTGDTPENIGDHVSFQDCQWEHNLALVGTHIVAGGSTTYGIADGNVEGNMQGGQTTEFVANSLPLHGFSFLGGEMFVGTLAGSETPSLHDVVLDDDVVVSGGNLALTGVDYIGEVENESTIYGGGGVIDIQSGGFNGVTSVMWGGGSLDSARSTVWYLTGATGGATTFPASFALLTAGGSVGCAIKSTSALTTLVCNQAAATGGNLDTQLGTVPGCVTAGGPTGFCNTPF